MRHITCVALTIAFLFFAARAFGASTTTLHGLTNIAVKPDLSIKSLTASAPAPNGRTPQQCNGAETVLTIKADVANLGTGDSPANNDPHAITVQDSKLSDWTAGHTLPAIVHGTDAIVAIDVPAYHDGPKMIGPHTFTTTLNGKQSTVAYTVPDGFCGLHTAKLTLITSTTKLPPSATQSLSKIVVTHVNTGVIKTPVPVPTIASPSGFGATFDVKVCVQHSGLAGAFICPTLVTTPDQTPLVWTWSPCGTQGCQQSIDGFHIYVVSTTLGGTGGKFGLHTYQTTRTLVQNQTDPSLTIVSIQNLGTVVYPNKCIVVTAYQGQNESGDSNPYCAATMHVIGQTPQTITLTPTNLQTSWTRVSIDEQYCSQGNPPFSAVNRGDYGGMVGGYDLMETDSRQCNNDVGNGAAYYARTAFVFDLSQLAGKSIISATFSTGYFQQTNFYYTGQKRPLCDNALILGFATTDWQSGFDHSQPIPMDDWGGVGYSASYVDFTSQVRHWLTNQPNYGMVVRGGVENANDFRSWGPGVCLGAAVGVQLIVTYT